MSVSSTAADSASARAATSRSYAFLTRSLPSTLAVVVDMLLWLISAQERFGNAADEESDKNCAEALSKYGLKAAFAHNSVVRTRSRFERVGWQCFSSCFGHRLELHDPAAMLTRQAEWRSLVSNHETTQACIQGLLEHDSTKSNDICYPGDSAQRRCASLARLLKACRSSAQLLCLWKALLLQKRVIFVVQPSDATRILVELVFAAALLLGPAVSDSQLHGRCRPLLLLSDTSWTACPGLIGGSNNPLIKTKASWWDVCIDVSRRTVVESTAGREVAGPPSALPESVSILLQQACDRLYSLATISRATTFKSLDRFLFPVQLHVESQSLQHSNFNNKAIETLSPIEKACADFIRGFTALKVTSTAAVQLLEKLKQSLLACSAKAQLQGIDVAKVPSVSALLWDQCGQILRTLQWHADDTVRWHCEVCLALRIETGQQLATPVDVLVRAAVSAPEDAGGARQ